MIFMQLNESKYKADELCSYTKDEVSNLCSDYCDDTCGGNNSVAKLETLI